VIKSIRANNFLSWEKLIFNVKDGVTLIDGFNRDDQTSEGSGKSAVLNALCWGLYGKIPKDANVDDVIKSGEKGCSTLIELEDIAIIRTRNKNELYIQPIGTTDKVKGKDVRETQKMIEEIIGMSFDTFCQTVYFAQNYPKKFITATQEDKGKILSEVQDLQIFDKARKEVMTLIKAEDKNITALTMQHQEKSLKREASEEAVTQLELQANRYEEERKQRISSFDNNIQFAVQKIQTVDSEIKTLYDKKNAHIQLSDEDVLKTNDLINNLKTAVASIQSKINDAGTHNNKLQALQQESTRYGTEIQRHINKTEQLTNFINNPSKNCPTCGTHLEDMDTSHAEAELLQIQNQIEEVGALQRPIVEQINNFVMSDVQELNKDLNEVNQQIYTNEQKLKSNENSKREYDQINSNIVAKVEQIKSISEDIKRIEAEKEAYLSQPGYNYQHDIDTKNSELVVLRSQEQEVEGLLLTKKKYINQLESLKSGFKEVKSYTFNSILAELTIKSNKYLQDLFEVPVTIQFKNDNMKIETEVKMDNESRGLGLLSGGQFRRTSLAVDLALSEIVALRTGSKMNIRILDEYFKDLSESSMEKCLRLLEKLGGSTILIEHNSIFKSIVDNVFECELIDGTTRSIA